ncbi:hypothetical protein [Luteibaculum oceani]|uniref:Uncharacterized protein n=1 Tax=Luteibaculum oceani TaxID=1294296 RepID=A0A5C6UV63_9FLAO|nr:hypothetical protein [Luteibaculum oceani]TXC76121.1 hypothetical protein FRX97_11455 [Luteibaculum oceani]
MKAGKIFTLTLIIGLSNLVFGQKDTIFKFTGEVIPCKLVEIGNDIIKYTRPELNPDLAFTINYSACSRVVTANGKNVVLQENLNNQENYSQQNKRAIKFNFLTPLTNYWEVSYEKSIEPGKSMEVNLGFNFGTTEIFGSSDEETTGFNARFGYKLLKSPDFYLAGMKYSHILKGAYIKPELVISSLNHSGKAYQYDHATLTSSEQGYSYKTLGAAFMVNLGKQVVYSDSFLIDYFVGIGYGAVTKYDESAEMDEDSYYYSYGTGEVHRGGIIITDGSPKIALSAGLRIGFLY